MWYIFNMKTMLVNGGNKKNPSKKHYSINSEAAYTIKDERGIQEEEYDRDSLSEDDLDRILASF